MTLGPKWIAIALNETKFFTIDEQDAPFIERINAVYFYNEAEHVYCCEITPSYLLLGLHHSIVFKPGIDLPEEERERLYEKYESSPVEDAYYHCSGIDSIPAEYKHPVSNSPDWLEEDDLGEEQVRQHLLGNHPF